MLQGRSLMYHRGNMICPCPRPLVTGNHFIVCGDNPLAYRITRELTGGYDETSS